MSKPSNWHLAKAVLAHADWQILRDVRKLRCSDCNFVFVMDRPPDYCPNCTKKFQHDGKGSD